jgi:hypothetical protein
MNEIGPNKFLDGLLGQVAYKIFLALAFVATIVMGIIEINKDAPSFDFIFTFLLIILTSVISGFVLYVVIISYKIRKPKSVFWYSATVIIMLYVIIFLFSNITYLLGNVGFWPWNEKNFSMYQLYIFFLDQTLKGVLFDISVNFPSIKIPARISVADGFVVFKVLLTAWQFFVTIFVVGIMTKIARHIYRKIAIRYGSMFSDPQSDRR